jgi:hypothetical protein
MNEAIYVVSHHRVGLCSALGLRVSLFRRPPAAASHGHRRSRICASDRLSLSSVAPLLAASLYYQPARSQLAGFDERLGWARLGGLAGWSERARMQSKLAAGGRIFGSLS